MDEIIKLSERLVVMSAQGAALLREVYGAPDSKIDLIPHGIPRVPFVSGSKDHLGVEGKSVILTFGLLSPDKGIEYVIDALPAILARHPDTVYIVLGATHPHVKERHGETYRLMLENRAQRLGVASSMIFHNRFVSQDELAEFLSAADIYITPYLQPEQITSGTLAYAVGLGQGRHLHAVPVCARAPRRRAWHPRAVARSAGDRTRGHRTSRRRREAARPARACGGPWSRDGVAGCRAPLRARASSARGPSTPIGCGRRFRRRRSPRGPPSCPRSTSTHLRLMTDDTGLLQHASFSVPRYDEGYCLDDNARALLLMALVEDAGTEDAAIVRALASRYLAFVSHAFDQDTRRFRNFLSYSRRVDRRLRVGGQSRSRALGARRRRRPFHRSRETESRRQLFHAALPDRRTFTSPRAWAYALLGIDEYLRAFQGDSNIQSVRKTLAERLLGSVPTDQRGRLAVVRRPRHVLQRAIATSAHRVRSVDGKR